MKISIEKSAGFCPGVINAIKIAEEKIRQQGKLLCLGDIVHNPEEVERLNSIGLKKIERKDLNDIRYSELLIRSHGEPPEIYKRAEKNYNRIIDATCKVVKSLQHKVRKAYLEVMDKNGQVVIYGKRTHPEVIGLDGQCDYNAIIIEDLKGVDKIDPEKPIRLFAQTTKSPQVYRQIADKILGLTKGKNDDIRIEESICNWMINRKDDLKKFANDHEMIIFVAGKKSSNGRFLFDICRKENKNSRFVSSPDDLRKEWFEGIKDVGISGATSTPMWLIEKIAKKIDKF